MPATNFPLASKVITSETPPSTQNIQGVPTAIAAFVGIAERGPIATPQFVTSFKAFKKKFGGYLATAQLAISVEGFFRNGGTQAWVSRTAHYSDPTDASTTTAAKGSMTLKDRGSAAAAAVLTSTTGPFALRPDPGAADPVLEVKFDGGSANSITLTATGAAVTTSAGTFALTNGWTLNYKIKEPGSTTLSPLRKIPIKTADYSAIGAATAQELVNAINKYGIGIEAKLNGSASTGTVTVTTDKLGSGAQLVIDATSTAGLLTALTLVAGTNNGSGAVADIDSVNASELASLLTAVPLSPNGSTAFATGQVLKLTGVTLGPSGSVQVTTNTTALGIFTGTLPITVAGTSNNAANTLTVTGKYPGTYIAGYKIVVTAATSGDANRFNLAVTKLADGSGESWPNLSMDPTDARYVEEFIASNSDLISATDLADVATAPTNSPALGSFSVWSGANDGLSGIADADFSGSQAGGTGLFAFDQIDNITLMVTPDRTTVSVQNAVATYCETSRPKQCFGVFDSPAGLDGPGIVDYVKTTAGLLELSEETAIFWPRIAIQNPSTTIFGSADTIVVPPSGHIAGVFSRADGSKPGGVYEAPAGLLQNFGVIYGAVGLETEDANDEAIRDLVYPSRINPICRVDGSPIHIDGHKTLKSTGNFPSIPERRGVNFIMTSLKKGTTFAKHRNNDRRLRQEVKRSVDAFLLRQYENKAFRGNTPNESFTSDFSDQVNPVEVVFAGELHGEIGLATQKPTDFIFLDFTQDTRALDERLSQLTASTSTNSNA